MDKGERGVGGPMAITFKFKSIIIESANKGKGGGGDPYSQNVDKKVFLPIPNAIYHKFIFSSE